MAAAANDEEHVEVKQVKRVKAQTPDSKSTRARALERDMKGADELDKRDAESSKRRRTGGPTMAEEAESDAPEPEAPETKAAAKPPRSGKA